MAVSGIMVWDGTGTLYRIFFFLLCALHYAAYQIKTRRSRIFESQGHWQHVMQLQSFSSLVSRLFPSTMMMNSKEGESLVPFRT